MRYKMILAKSAAVFLLLVFAMSAAQAHAQNQTPANVAPIAGGWTDPATGLTWIQRDNGSDVNWDQAKAYCSNLRLGGYSDWRLPTIDELQGIYDPNAGDMHVKGNLKLSCNAQWSSTQGSAPGTAEYLYFSNGERNSVRLSDRYRDRSLCVRR
jgi:hypothetical protein